MNAHCKTPMKSSSWPGQLPRFHPCIGSAGCLHLNIWALLPTRSPSGRLLTGEAARIPLVAPRIGPASVARVELRCGCQSWPWTTWPRRGRDVGHPWSQRDFRWTVASWILLGWLVGWLASPNIPEHPLKQTYSNDMFFCCEANGSHIMGPGPGFLWRSCCHKCCRIWRRFLWEATVETTKESNTVPGQRHLPSFFGFKRQP